MAVVGYRAWWQGKSDHYLLTAAWSHCILSSVSSNWFAKTCGFYEGYGKYTLHSGVSMKGTLQIKWQKNNSAHVVFWPASHICCNTLCDISVCVRTRVSIVPSLIGQLSETVRSLSTSRHYVNISPCLKGESQNGVQLCLGEASGFQGHTHSEKSWLYDLVRRWMFEKCRGYRCPTIGILWKAWEELFYIYTNIRGFSSMLCLYPICSKYSSNLHQQILQTSFTNACHSEVLTFPSTDLSLFRS